MVTRSVCSTTTNGKQIQTYKLSSVFRNVTSYKGKVDYESKGKVFKDLKGKGGVNGTR